MNERKKNIDTPNCKKIYTINLTKSYNTARKQAKKKKKYTTQMFSTRVRELEIMKEKTQAK